MGRVCLSVYRCVCVPLLTYHFPFLLTPPKKTQRLLAKTKKPYVVKRPDRVLLGHAAPVVACAISYALGVAATASAGEVGGGGRVHRRGVWVA